MNRKFTIFIAFSRCILGKMGKCHIGSGHAVRDHVIFKLAIQTSLSPSSITLTQAASLRHHTFNLFLSSDAEVIQRHTRRFEEGASTRRRHGSQPRSFATSASIRGFASRPLHCRSVPMPINVPTDDLQRYLRRRPSSRPGARCTAVKIILARSFLSLLS